MFFFFITELVRNNISKVYIYVLQSLKGQPCATNFLILILRAVRELTSLIPLGILFHNLIFAIESIPKCVEWMFDLVRQLRNLNT